MSNYVEKTCPVCGNTIHEHDDDMLPVRVCYDCRRFCPDSEIEFGDVEGPDWFKPINIEATLDKWRDRYAERLHIIWSRNEGSPHVVHEGVDYHEYWSSSDYTCSHCKISQDKSHKSMRIDIDGVPYCSYCARELVANVGYILSWSDGHYYLSDVFPWQLQEGVDQSKIVHPPEEILDAYYERARLAGVVSDWAVSIEQ